jgi:hypothetical protein
MSSAMIHGVSRDAEHIATHITAHVPSAPPVAAAKEPVGA